MVTKQLAMLAALLGIATPGQAFDTRNEAQTVMFYYAIPLGVQHERERISWMGMQIQGKRDFQSYSVDTPLMRFEEGGAAVANALLVGAVAVGAVALVGGRGKSSQQEVQQQQAQQAAVQAQKPPATVPCPATCP
jgi:anaerobic glycerol-3-phosphate dehydrogenase